jgi:hypothetical protein
VAGRDGNGKDAEDLGRPRPRYPIVSDDVEPPEERVNYATIAHGYNEFITKELLELRDEFAETKSAALAALSMSRDSRDISRENRDLLHTLTQQLGEKRVAANFPAPTAPSSPLPMMRDPESTYTNLDRIGQRVMRAALEGQARPDSNPEEMVLQVIADERAKHERDRELARLQGLEKKREEVAETTRLARANARRNAFYGFIGAIALTGTFKLLQWLFTLHH